METLWPWILFNLFIVAMLAIDLLVFNRKVHVINMKEAVGWSILWISLALAFNVYIYFTRGSHDAINFLTGYLIEKSLSVDNLFVFLLLFKYFHTPRQSMHKVLFYGVLGAVVMRGIFIWLGIELVTRFHWIVYFFGAFLVYSGIKLGMEKDKEIHPEKNPILRIFRYFFPITKDYEEDKFFIVKQGRYFATPLFVVLLSIETADLVFAIDSVPAVLAITYDPFIVYTSNIFAILGLRSLYFVLSHMLELFHHLHYGISFILIFVGLKMLIADFFPISNVAALLVISAALAISILASIKYPRTAIKK